MAFRGNVPAGQNLLPGPVQGISLLQDSDRTGPVFFRKFRQGTFTGTRVVEPAVQGEITLWRRRFVRFRL